MNYHNFYSWKYSIISLYITEIANKYTGTAKPMLSEKNLLEKKIPFYFMKLCFYFRTL